MKLLELLGICLLISGISFGGGAQALFYQFGVAQAGWITSADLTSVLAFGYATPGPAVFGTALFIGYRIAGWGGVLVGFVGIFILPWLLSLIATKHIAKVLDHPAAAYGVQGIGLAAAGVVAATAWGFLPAFQGKGIGYLLLSLGAFLATRYGRLHPLLLIGSGVILGLWLG